jgi:hypothetical protein
MSACAQRHHDSLQSLDASAPIDGAALERDVGVGAPDAASTTHDADTAPGDGESSSNDSGPIADGAAPLSDGCLACTGAPYCFTTLTPSHVRADVREPVTLIPQISNPGRQALSFRVDPSEIKTTRRPQLPPARIADLSLVLVASSTTGIVTFTVNDVPPWYAETTFTIRLHASSATGSDVCVDASISVRGNTLLAASGGGIYAVASDGRPARSVRLTQGLLVGTPYVELVGSLLVAQDGTLLVADAEYGGMMPRLKRFELSGEDVALPAFAATDSQNVPLIPSQSSISSLGQLLDGRVAALLPAQSIVLWHADGSYDRTLVSDALSPWSALAMSASRTANELLLVDRYQVTRIDPDTGSILGEVTTQVVDCRSLLSLPTGDIYAGCAGEIDQISPQGVLTKISMIPNPQNSSWGWLGSFSDGRVIASDGSTSDSTGVIIVDQTSWIGFVRAQNSGNATVEVDGLAYLE